MTDEKLIEAAAKAMAPPLIFDGTFTEYSRAYDNHRVSDRDADQEYWVNQARAAFAVFEKAYAPTVDSQFYEGLAAARRAPCIRAVPGSVIPCCGVSDGDKEGTE